MPDPTLLFIIGPPAVGKMAVGHEISERTGFPLFHNHMTIEPVLRFFEFGTPPFARLVEGFRRALFEEVAASDLPGLIFTYVWAFDLPTCDESVERYATAFRARGSRVLFVELETSLEERLRRNEHEWRLAEKPSKRDIPRSRELLLQHEAEHRFNSTNEFAGNPDHLRLDNTNLLPAEAADLVITHFALPRKARPDPAGRPRT
ncbi:AAA family ATPase [Actinoplanes sp. NPDC026619]|uniref:AAA family ATPase n=1 Tax=Actinoplanes sp. NPDC026619 TaxID=3155798 RepID=UPI0033CF0674